MKKFTKQLLGYIRFASILVGLCITFNTQTLWSQSKSTLFDSLNQVSALNVRIEVDIDTLLAGKLTPAIHDGKMEVFSEEALLFGLPLKISVRSKSRRRYCDFPPLKFNFVKADLENIGLNRQDDYKIVTHCLHDPEGEEILLKEFLVYELYQILTPVSLRAKLIDMTYINSENDQELEKKAIILESEKEFAENMKGKLCNCMGTPRDSIDPFLFEQMAMFQYMVGNIDMDPIVERNVTLIRQGANKPMIPIAYDFDYAAIVNAPYVFPKVKDNRMLKRTYLGFPENEAVMEKVKQTFKEKKSTFLDHVEQFDSISKKERRLILTYLNKFYKEIQDPDFKPPYGKGF
jgi:hypothetical protein